MIYSIILGPKDEGGGAGVEPASSKESLSRGESRTGPRWKNPEKCETKLKKRNQNITKCYSHQYKSQKCLSSEGGWFDYNISLNHHLVVDFSGGGELAKAESGAKRTLMAG